ncbi:MAG: hypothetical protein M0P97_04615 [Candidatus Moranbacteria bacterium]|jgi:hypothetical protein|nr:hypothetical protein [Candidatus Moranbacteria bacterium]
MENLGKPQEHDKELWYPGGEIRGNWLGKIKNLDDSQELNIYETNHSSMQTYKHKITAGELRKILLQTEAYIKFDDGGVIDLSYHDFYKIEVVTPEIKEAEREEEKIITIERELEKLGVDSEIFYEIREMTDKKRILTPEKIVEYGKIIEKYLREKTEDDGRGEEWRLIEKGIEPNLFFDNWDEDHQVGVRRDGFYRGKAITVENIVEYGKIIEKYLQGKKNS